MSRTRRSRVPATRRRSNCMRKPGTYRQLKMIGWLLDTIADMPYSNYIKGVTRLTQLPSARDDIKIRMRFSDDDND